MFSRFEMRKSLAFVLVPLLAVGCTANALRGTVPSTAQAPGAEAPLVEASEAAFGSVRVGVRWPDYQAQTIPFSAAALEVALLNGSTPVATASIVRPASSATLTRLPVGTYTVRIEARRSDTSKTVVADASAPITVVANRIAAASLVLNPLNGPRLDYIHPTSGPPGTSIALNGANLWPPSGGTYSVLVDGLPAPTSLLQPGINTVYLTDLPSWAGNSATLSISVDGVPIPVSQHKVFTRQIIHHLALTPTTATLATHQQQAYVAKAYQDAAGTIQVLGVAFSWSLTDVYPQPDATFGSNYFTLQSGIFKATATGSATVRVEAGGKFATASVVVDTIGTEPTPGPGPGGAP